MKQGRNPEEQKNAGFMEIPSQDINRSISQKNYIEHSNIQQAYCNTPLGISRPFAVHSDTQSVTKMLLKVHFLSGESGVWVSNCLGLEKVKQLSTTTPCLAADWGAFF